MRIKHLLYSLVALPLLFVACDEKAPVDEVKNPTIELTAGEATESTLSFTIATTEATDVAWLAVEATETTPTASEVLANGAKIEANKSVSCTATELEDATEYTIVAVVKNSKAVDKKEIKMTTEASDPEATQFKRKSAAEAEFAAEGGNGEIEYEIVNPIEGVEVTAEADVEWITATAGEKITYTVAANDGEAREGKITAAYGELSFEVTVKQAAKKNDEPEDNKVEFTASVYEVYYYGTQYSTAYNYQVYLSDNGLNENGYYKQNGVYYMLDIYAADSAENTNFTLPNGKYTASESSNAGTFGIGDYGACITVVDGVPTYDIYMQGTVTVTDGKIEASIMMEDGEIHHVVYEGDLKFGGDEPEDPEQPLEATHTADKWLWGGSSSYGNKYQVVGEGFSVDVHFPEQYAQENALAEGDYIWTSTTWFGYNDFENEFTTRSFNVNGTSVAVDSGSAKVAKSGEEYAIQLVLDGRDGVKYVIEFNGILNEKEDVGGETTEAVAFSKIEYKTYNSSFYYYEYLLTNAAGDKMTLCVNDYQATEAVIYTDDSFEWITRSYAGNLGFFSTANIVVGGVSYDAVAGSMVVATDEATYAMDITINLDMANGAKMTFTVNGKMNEENGGGTTPSEPTKLDTPSVSGIVSGNAATISWQEVAGAKDYTVTLNGSLVSTVAETYIVYSDLEYNTTYSVSVVANPADSAVNSASNAGTATFTTEADPNAGGNEGGNGNTESYENWAFDASLNMGTFELTLTDGTRTLYFKLSELAGATFVINGTGALNASNVAVDGVAASDASGTVQISTNLQYKVVIDAVINGVKYTGTSNNPVV